MGEQIGWGILGTGSIAGSFATGLRSATSGRLVAVGSRRADNSAAFGSGFALTPGQCHGSYQALLDDPAVDAVYVALPNDLHSGWTIRAAQAGKHVLCEKPLARNALEAAAVLDAVRPLGVTLMEAFMYRCHPQTARIVELVADGALGEIRMIEAGFAYDDSQPWDLTNVRMSNPMGGGGIMDVGCYPVSMSRLLAGSEPISVRGVATIDESTRVDVWAAASLKFPNGVVASLVCGMGVATANEVRIWGTGGGLIVSDPWKPFAGPNPLRLLRQDRPEETIVVAGGNDLYAIEADTFGEHLNDGQVPAMTWDDSLGNMAVLDAWRAEVGLGFDGEPR
jgi:predicted dehydrogenase